MKFILDQSIACWKLGRGVFQHVVFVWPVISLTHNSVVLTLADLMLKLRLMPRLQCPCETQERLADDVRLRAGLKSRSP